MTTVDMLLVAFLLTTAVAPLWSSCLPDGWQSGRAVTLGVTKNSAKPSVTRNMGDVIYSTSWKKIWIDENTFSSDEARVTRLYDYPGKVLYTVHGEDGDANQTCVKTVLPGPFTPVCVPLNATMTHYKSYYGVTPPYVQFFKEFQWEAESVTNRVSFTYDDTPLFQQQWGQRDGESFFKTAEYYNSTIWGKMPANIFDPPKVCDQVLLQPAGAEASADTLVTSFLL